MVAIFKVYETVNSQEDPEIQQQIKICVTPLILHCIGLVVQVFNDQPSKIQTFVANGLFRGIVRSLSKGGIPAVADFPYYISSFMQVLTLNSDTFQLLRDSGLVKQFFNVCEQPQRYARFIAQRRREP